MNALINVDVEVITHNRHTWVLVTHTHARTSRVRRRRTPARARAGARVAGARARIVHLIDSQYVLAPETDGGESWTWPHVRRDPGEETLLRVQGNAHNPTQVHVVRGCRSPRVEGVKLQSFSQASFFAAQGSVCVNNVRWGAGVPNWSALPLSSRCEG